MSEKAKRNRMNFTEANVRSLKPKKKQFHVWDADTDAARGLGILVSPTGTKSYRATYRFPGRYAGSLPVPRQSGRSCA
jgi:hypothetical protein